MTRGEKIIAWIEPVCRVPEGALVGQPIKLIDWQKDAIKKTYDNPQPDAAVHHLGRPEIGKNMFRGDINVD